MPDQKKPVDSADKDDDQVTAAYESISKKWESMKRGEYPKPDDEEESEETKDHDDMEKTEPEGDQIDPEELKKPLEALPGTEDDGASVKKAAPAEDPLDMEGEEDEKPEEDDFEDDPVQMHSKVEEEEDRDNSNKEEDIKPRHEETDDEAQFKPRPTFQRRDEVEEESNVRPVRHEEMQPEGLDDLASDDYSKSTSMHPQISNPRMNPDDFQDEAEDQTHIPRINHRPEQFSQEGEESYNSDVFTPKPRDEESEPGNFFNKHATSRPRRSAKWQFLLLIIIGIAVIGGTVYFLKGKMGGFGFSAAPSPTPTATPLPTPTPTPTPTPVERANFKLQVLNGTTKTGMAQTVSDKLKGLGYQTEKGTNATNSAFQRTQVRVKEGNASLSAQLIKDLSPDYDAQESAPLKSSDKIDAQIILGLK